METLAAGVNKAQAGQQQDSLTPFWSIRKLTSLPRHFLSDVAFFLTEVLNLDCSHRGAIYKHGRFQRFHISTFRVSETPPHPCYFSFYISSIAGKEALPPPVAVVPVCSAHLVL